MQNYDTYLLSKIFNATDEYEPEIEGDDSGWEAIVDNELMQDEDENA